MPRMSADSGYQVETADLLGLAARLGPLEWVHRVLPGLPSSGTVPNSGEVAAAFGVVFEWLAGQEKQDRRSVVVMRDQIRQAAQAVVGWDSDWSRVGSAKLGSVRSATGGQLVK